MGCAQVHVQPLHAEVSPSASSSCAWKTGHSGLNANEIAARNQQYPDEVILAGAERQQPKCMGTYTKTTYEPGRPHDSRPIYKNSRGRFLYFHAAKNVWLISFSFNDAEGLLKSPVGVEFPPTSSWWTLRNGTMWDPVSIRATAKVDNGDGIKRGDLVRVAPGCHSDLFHEGERGLVVGRFGCSYRVRFEGRHEAVTVAAWRLIHLAEGLGMDGYVKKDWSFSLPVDRALERHIEDTEAC